MIKVDYGNRDRFFQVLALATLVLAFGCNNRNPNNPNGNPNPNPNGGGGPGGHFQSGQGWNSGGGDLPQQFDQFGDVYFQDRSDQDRGVFDRILNSFLGTDRLSGQNSFDPEQRPALNPRDQGVSLEKIANKVANGPSRLGIEAELVSRSELQYLKTLAEEGNSAAQSLYHRLKTLEGELISHTRHYSRAPYPEILRKGAGHSAQALSPDELREVLDAKKDWINLNYQGGSVISLRSYESDASSGVKELKRLAELQSDQIDNAVNEYLFSEHVVHNTTSLGHSVRVLIQGGGPTGLYTAIKEYEAGADVTLVNNRDEDYKRKQIIRMDSKWQVQLQFYLGKGFDDLFRSSGKGVFKPDGYVETPISEIEKALKARLDRFLIFLSNHRRQRQLYEEPNPSKDLKLLFEYAVVGLEAPIGDAQDFDVVIQPSGRSNGNSDGARGRPRYRYIPTDILVLAGGANNPIRNRYLSPASIRTDQKVHSISVWNKSEHGVKMIKDDDFRGKIKREALARIIADPAEDIDGQVSRFLHSHFIPEEMRRKYPNVLSELIRTDTSEDEIDVRQFENRESVYLAYKLPNKMGELRLDVERLRADRERERRARGDDDDTFERSITVFLKDLETRWHIGAMRFLTFHNPADRQRILTPDPNPISHGSFTVSQMTGKHTTAIYHHNENSKVVVVAVGDSVVTPHFMTWSGLNAGRGTVDDLFDVSKRYIQEPEHEYLFTAELQRRHDATKAFILKRGTLFLHPLPEEEQTHKAYQSMIDVLDKLVKHDKDYPSMQEVDNLRSASEEIGRNTEETQPDVRSGGAPGNYEIVWRALGSEHSIPFQVNPDGTLSSTVPGYHRSVYSTYLELFFDLKGRAERSQSSEY